MEPIIFYKGEENGIVVEKNNYESSLFNSQYKKAFEIFLRIWNTQKPMVDRDAEGEKEVYHGMDNRFSNIISFCGDRGEGKSSCMSSFTAMLTEVSARKSASDSGLVDSSFIKPEEIELLDFIDPSFFDDQHNILELLIGRMYTSVNTLNRQNKDYESQLYRIRELREQFQRVKTSLGVLHKKDETNFLENLEELDELAAGIRLKQELDELFRLYLKFVNRKRILICIDDLDLNMSQGYKMVELIRKYLIGKYCIILISVKIEQLVDIVSIAMRNELGCCNVTLDYCQLMAQKYVTKFLSQSNRIYMPSGEALFDRELYLLESRTSDKNEGEKMTVKERAVQLIFQKTGYVFYNIQGVSPIVPTNLRSLRHLLAALLDLPDYKDELENDSEEGRIAFRKYFWGTWVPQRLAREDYDFATQLYDYTDASSLNSFVIEYFSNRVEAKHLTPSEETSFYRLYHAIIKKENVTVNTSYGDVMYVLWLIGRITDDTEIHRLIFFIKTVYSMRLYATYNIVTSQENASVYPSLMEGGNIAIHKSDRYYLHVNELQRLVNGSYFVFPGSAIFPAEKTADKTNESRDRRVVPFKAIREYFQKFLKEWGTDKALDVQRLRICEFLAMCISRTTSSRDIETDGTDKGLNRISMTPTYIGRFSDTSNYAVFDFLHPFYSLCNIEYAYRRFDSIIPDNIDVIEKGEDPKISLYTIALKEPDSLLSALLRTGIAPETKSNTDDEQKEEAKKEEKSETPTVAWENLHRLMSDAIIRNSDVQTAIFDALIQARDIHKVSKYNEILKLAYQDIRNLEITLHPLIRKQEDSNADISDPSCLTFVFLSVLIEFLTKVNEAEFLRLLSVTADQKVNDAKAVFVGKLVPKLIKQKYPIAPKDLISAIIKITAFNKAGKDAFKNSLEIIFTKETYTLKEVNELEDAVLESFATVWLMLNKK